MKITYESVNKIMAKLNENSILSVTPDLEVKMQLRDHVLRRVLCFLYGAGVITTEDRAWCLCPDWKKNLNHLKRRMKWG